MVPLADSSGRSNFKATALANGGYTLTATATDANGQTGTSSEVAVNVNNAVPTSVAVSPPARLISPAHSARSPSR
jgi:hypothetical protein